MLRWDRRRLIEPLALQSTDTARLLGAMTEQERMSSWHLVDVAGGVESAGAAIAPLLRLLPGGAPLAAVAARMPGLIERAYAWTAAHRSGFGSLVTAGARARADAVIARRVARDPAGVS